MPAKDKDQMGEYEAAMLLPEDEHTALLHKYAVEHQQMYHVDALESALRTARLMRERWEHDLRYVGSEGFKPFVGSREAARCCVLTESLHGKLVALRNRSYRFARAKLFHWHGVRIEFATWPDTTTAPAAVSAQPEVEAVMEADEPASQTAASETPAAGEAPADRLVEKREVKAVLRRLHDKGVKGAELQAFKRRCLAGNVTENQMREWARELAGVAHAA